MTTETFQVYVLEGGRQVAFFAGYRGMQAQQRETGQAVVENDAVTPPGCLVAALAFFAFLALVYIVSTVTAETLDRQIFLVQIAAMTSVALQFPMLAL